MTTGWRFRKENCLDQDGWMEIFKSHYVTIMVLNTIMLRLAKLTSLFLSYSNLVLPGRKRLIFTTKQTPQAL